MDHTEFIILRDVQVLLQWIDCYVCKAHPDLGRPGPVCPFVKPSLDKGKLLTRFSYEIDGSDREKIEQKTYEYMRAFMEIPLSNEQDRLSTALVVAFPNIPQDKSGVLDSIQVQVKTEFVRNGLMVGQFHQTCSEPGIHNGDFAVSRSPFALLAMRYMALHDILFLNQEKVWFDAYYLHYGARYERGQVSNREGFVDLFYKTQKRLSGTASL